MSRYDEYKKVFPSQTENERLAEKYQLHVASDCMEQISIGDMTDKLISAHEEGRFVEEFDKNFLFGAWGDVMKEIVDFKFTQDTRGLVLYLVATISTQNKRINGAISESGNVLNMLDYLNGKMDDEP